MKHGPYPVILQIEQLQKFVSQFQDPIFNTDHFSIKQKSDRYTITVKNVSVPPEWRTAFKYSMLLLY